MTSQGPGPSTQVERGRKGRRYTLLVVIMFILMTLFYYLVSVSSVQTSPYVLPNRPGWLQRALQNAKLTPKQSRGYGLDILHNEKINSTTEYKTGMYIFNMANSLTHGDFVNRIKTSGFKCGKFSETTSLNHSRMYISSVNRNTGVVSITIDTFNQLGVRKTVGGDVIVLWAEQSSGTSIMKRIPGSVTDNMNGSYTGQIKIFRSKGTFRVYAKVLSIYRTHCLRFKAMEFYDNSVFSLPSGNSYGIMFTFAKGKRTDVTRCGPVPAIYGYRQLCNFTRLNHNYSYYCGKPGQGLTCSDYTSFNMRQYNLQKIGLQVPQGDIINDPGWGLLAQTLPIRVSNVTGLQKDHRGELPACYDYPKVNSWNMQEARVYIENQTWRHVACRYKLPSQQELRACLANKTIYFAGDSTIRQYVEAIASHISEVVNYFPFYVTLTSETDNINVTWRKHELPFHNVAVRDPNQVNSTARQIRAVADDISIRGSDLILGFTYNTHLQAFSPNIFRDRIKRLVGVLRYLFEKKPETLVFFKGPHVANVPFKWFDARLSLLYVEILQEEFASLKDKVRFLDVFTLSVLNNNQDLHPVGMTLKNQFQQLIAYICP